MGQQKSKIISGEPEPKKKYKTKTETETKIKTKAEKKKIKGKKIQDKKSDKKTKKRSKKYVESKKKLKIRSFKSVEKAIHLIKEVSTHTFNASFEAHIALNLKSKETLNLKNIKIDKGGVIHSKIGKTSDKTEKIAKNFTDLVKIVLKARPAGKKDFIKSVAICSTMSPSIKINI